MTLVSPDSHEAGRLLSRYGVILGRFQGDYAGAQDALERALVIAQREEDIVLEMRTLANTAETDFFHLRYRESERKCSRVIDIARSTHDLHAEITATLYAARALDSIGDSGTARHYTARMLPIAERLQDQWWRASALWLNQISCCLEGDWESARDFTERGLRVEPMNPRLLGTGALLEYEAGGFDQGKAYLERLLEAMGENPPGPITHYAIPALVVPLIARITAASDAQFDVAEEGARTILSSPFATPFYVLTVSSGLALLAVLRKDVSAAAEHYTVLESARGTMPKFVAEPAIDRLLGLLSMTMGRIDQAGDHFEDALTFCRKAGYRPELAWSCHDYADGLLRREARGDREKAMSLLDESLAISTELGMRPLLERVVALQERAESQPAKAPAYPDGLTRREVEVLRLIAAGKTDREIADELFISVKTVGYHVGNILNKTTSSNRTEAASYAAQHDLTRQGNG